MTFVPSDLNVLNYPIETDEAKALWASKHKCNKMKAIIAFSLDEANANDNLRRYGYTRAWRQKALSHYYIYANQPTCAGIPLTPLSTPWWECMPDSFPDYEVPNTGDARWIVNFNKDGHVEIPEWTSEANSTIEFDLYLPQLEVGDVIGLVSGTGASQWFSADYQAADLGPNGKWSSGADLGKVFVDGEDVSGYRTKAIPSTPKAFRVVIKVENAGVVVKCLGSNEQCLQPLKGSITNIRFTTPSGNDNRFYPGYIDGSTKPTSTAFVDTISGKNGTFTGFTGDVWKTRTPGFVPTPPSSKDWVINYTGTGKVSLPVFAGPGKVSHKVIFDVFPSSTVNDGATDTYFVVNDQKQFYWSGFSNVKINGNPATWQMEVETGVEYTIEADLNEAKNITEISGYGGSFNLKGTVYNLTMNSDAGDDTRNYVGIIESDTLPTTTSLDDTGGGNKHGTIDSIPAPQWKEKV